MTTSTGQFDFTPFNNVTRNVPAGMKLVLAESLIKDAIYAMEKHDNPLTPELLGIGEELKSFKIKYKAAREEARQEQQT